MNDRVSQDVQTSRTISLIEKSAVAAEALAQLVFPDSPEGFVSLMSPGSDEGAARLGEFLRNASSPRGAVYRYLVADLTGIQGSLQDARSAQVSQPPACPISNLEILEVFGETYHSAQRFLSHVIHWRKDGEDVYFCPRINDGNSRFYLVTSSGISIKGDLHQGREDQLAFSILSSTGFPFAAEALEAELYRKHMAVLTNEMRMPGRS